MSSVIWRLNQWMSRLMPDAFVLAVLLTFAVMGLAKALTPAGFFDILEAWGGGFWTLLSFAMQMCLVMLTGFIVGESPYVRRLLFAFTALARDDRAACVLMAFSSMALAWVHWGLSIAGSAVLVRYFAVRQNKVHYPLLVACAYFGMGALWHAGLSGSAPLLAATPGHFLEASLGVIPLSRTIFSVWNLAMTAATLAALSFMAFWMYPKAGEPVIACSEETLDRFHDDLVDRDEKQSGKKIGQNLAEKLETSYGVNLVFLAFGACYLFVNFSRGAWNFDLNRFNFVFFILSIALHPNVKSFLAAANEGAHSITGIVLQFPLYAGMYGIIKSTGLSEVLGKMFTAVSTQATFPLAVYFYSGILNYFVPSGGSKWAIEAPYLMDAAASLGVPASKLVLAYSWGDMVTDLIQPFFCLPLLAVAGIEFRRIMGYLTVAFLGAMGIGAIGVLILGTL